MWGLLIEPRIRKKGTLIFSGLLGNLEYNKGRFRLAGHTDDPRGDFADLRTVNRDAPQTLGPRP